MNSRPSTGHRRAAALALSALACTAAAQPEPPDYGTAIELYLQAGREMARQQQMRAPYMQPPTVQRFTTPGLRDDAWWMHRWLDSPVGRVSTAPQTASVRLRPALPSSALPRLRADRALLVGAAGRP